jgi:hypothetical protein
MKPELKTRFKEMTNVATVNCHCSVNYIVWNIFDLNIPSIMVAKCPSSMECDEFSHLLATFTLYILPAKHTFTSQKHIYYLHP